MRDSVLMAMLPPDPIYIFKGEMLSISCIAFKISDFAQRLFAGTHSGNVHIWDLKSKREVGNLKAGDSPCLSVCIEQGGEKVVTHCKSGEVSFWKEDSGEWILNKVVKIDFFGFCKCQIHRDAVYAPVRDGKCELISLTTTERLGTANLWCEGGGDMMALKVCEVEGREVAMVAYEGFKLGLWDLKEGRMVSSLSVEECPMALDYAPVTGKGLCGGPGDQILVFSLEKNLEFAVRRKVPLTNPGVAAVRIRPDGKLVAVGCWDGRLRLYSWKSLVLLAVLDIHSSTVQDVSFTEDYTEGNKVRYLLAAGSQDSKISLWDLYN